MKTIIKMLREAKLSSLKISQDENISVVRESRKNRKSLVDILRSASIPALLGEIHQKAQYNGTGFDCSVSEIAKFYNQRCDAIVVATDNILFDGKIEWIQEIREITKKPIVVLDLFLEERQIRQISLLGADAVILIASFLNKEELLKLRNIAKEEGQEVIIEV